jgi:FKBP-type peptidyl-prolyl cis-trans isomerase
MRLRPGRASARFLFCTVLFGSSGCERRAEAVPAQAPPAAEVEVPAAPAPPRAPAPADVAAPPADATRHEGGVASKQLAAGRGGEPPAANDCVRAEFASWKRDGTPFSSSAGHAPPLQCLGTMIPGLRTAVLTMREGERRRVWVPGPLTFIATEPDEPAPTDDLTFELQLLDIVRAPATPAELDRPAARAKKTKSGLAYLVLTPGTGSEHPGAQSRVRVRFSGWKRDGSLFETTELADQPSVITVSEVMPGLREALALMVAGDKTRFWIPAKLAYGDKPTRKGFPAGSMVYDLELLAIEQR